MKRVGKLYEKIIEDGNLRRAIKAVCDSHRWIVYPKKPNRTVVWIEGSMDGRVEELRSVIERGFVASPVRKKRRYDHNARKWRDIAEPRLWPDQCVHHALIQVLEPVMMRGMDHWCCGSIKGRGAHYGIRAIKKWLGMRGVKWCVEMDIRHFYDSLDPELVLGRMRELIKDGRTLDLIWGVIKDGVLIGSYCSQWFANTFLQPLDSLIRQMGARRYLRYMDNFTVFTSDKRTADRVIRGTAEWLRGHGLSLKGNWQKFRVTDRMPNALGYRYGKRAGKVRVLLRKHSLLRLKQQLGKYYRMRERGRFVTAKFAQGLISRLGMLRHCNSTKMYRELVRKKTQRQLKAAVRDYYRKEKAKWTMFLGRRPETA